MTRWTMLLIILSYASAGYAFTNRVADHLQQSAVGKIERVGTLLRITYSQPCGSNYVALALKPTQKPKHLLASIILEQQPTTCTGLPQAKVLYIKSIKQDWLIQPDSSFQTKATRNVLFPIRVLSSQLRQNNDQRFVEVAYTRECRSPDLILLKEKGQQLHIGLTHLQNKKKKNAESCQDVRPVSAPMEFIKAQNFARLKPMTHFTNEATADAPYQIKLTKVMAAQPQEYGRLKIKYRQKCNETLIGLVANEKNARKSEKHFQLGVLVTEFPGFSCPKGSAKIVDFVMNDVTFPTPLHWQPFSQPRGDYNLILDHTTKPQFQMSATGPTLELHHTRSCEEALGAVFALDRHGQLATSVLLRKKLGRTCPQPFQNKIYRTSLRISPQQKQLYPLHLGGSYADATARFAGQRQSLPGWTKS